MSYNFFQWIFDALEKEKLIINNENIDPAHSNVYLLLFEIINRFRFLVGWRTFNFTSLVHEQRSRMRNKASLIKTMAISLKNHAEILSFYGFSWVRHGGRDESRIDRSSRRLSLEA